MNVNTHDAPLANLDADMEAKHVEYLKKYSVLSTEWNEKYIPERKYFVENLIAQGLSTLIIGKPKTGKSYFAMQMAICIAHGIPFLEEFKTTPAKILYVNCEVEEDYFRDRFNEIKARLGITKPEKYPIDFINTPPELCWDAIFSYSKKTKPEIVIADCLYKVETFTETNERECKEIVKKMARFRAEGITLIVVHHDGKGWDGEKNGRDSGSGHSVFTRDTKCKIDILMHSNVEEARVIRFTESFQYHSPITVIFGDNVFKRADELSPTIATAKSHAQNNANSNKATDEELEKAILAVIEEVKSKDGYDGKGTPCETFINLVQRHLAKNMRKKVGKDRTRFFINELADDGKIVAYHAKLEHNPFYIGDKSIVEIIKAEEQAVKEKKATKKGKSKRKKD